MLITELGSEHKKELQEQEDKYSQQFREQAENEKQLQQSLALMKKYAERIEKERTAERTQKLKLEEEYLQNTRNHEEEVQLRMKFEQKLNTMHSDFRDLSTRCNKAERDFAHAKADRDRFEALLNAKSEEVTEV